MTKIAVVAAHGKAGRLIVSEALNRGFDVTAVVRGENKSEAHNVITKDIFDLTAEDLKDFDAVVDAFGVHDPDKFDQHTTTLHHLSDLLSGSDTRLLVVGGAGSLFTNPEHTAVLSEGFPEEFKGIPVAMGKALDALRKRDDVRWTYISPAANFIPDGKRTGTYVVAGDEYTTNEEGVSEISYADYAVAVIDEIEHGNHIHERISLRW